MNSDIEIIEPNTVQRLFESINKKENIKVVGPKLLTKNKKPQKYDHGELCGWLAKISMKFGRSYWKNRDNIIKCAWVSGAVFLIEKTAFDHIGGFDENFFLYKEEEDLCLMLRQEGYEILYDPSIKVLHYGSVVASKSKYMKKSQEYFNKKHLK